MSVICLGGDSVQRLQEELETLAKEREAGERRGSGAWDSRKDGGWAGISMCVGRSAERPVVTYFPHKLHGCWCARFSHFPVLGAVAVTC